MNFAVKRTSTPMMLILDINNMAYRALYTLKLSNQGKDVSVLFGVLRMTLGLVKKLHPSSVVACFDGGTPQFRKALVPTYKAHRTHDDSIDWDAVFDQIGELKTTALPVHGIMAIRQRGAEADDLMYHATRLALDDVTIVTSDDDLLQAVGIGDTVQVYNPTKDVTVNIHNFESICGVPVERFVVAKTFVGDSSDGIPGIKGIGRKTVEKLVRTPTFDSSMSRWNWGAEDIGVLTSSQRKTMQSTLPEYFWKMHSAIDLSRDRVRAHHAIYDAQWVAASTRLMTKYAYSKKFMSLIADVEYPNVFRFLSQPEFDLHAIHPVERITKEPCSFE